jgi:two-component system chemotaxis response regulator CheY
MLKILVVDDSVMMRNSVKTYLKNSGHTLVGEAESGLLALDICRETKPDLITMDITMPDMDGLEAIEKIREFNKEVKILVVTSHGQEEVIMHSLKAGAQGYILKPITQENFDESVNNIFKNSEKIKEEEYLLDE